MQCIECRVKFTACSVHDTMCSAVCSVQHSVQCSVMMFQESWLGSICVTTVHLTQSHLHTAARGARNHCENVQSVFPTSAVANGCFAFWVRSYR